MPIRLNWTETNFGEDGHRIYRSTSPIDPQALPTPLDTVGPSVVQYDDVTAVDGETYYYRVSAYLGSVEQVSDELQITAESFDPSQFFEGGLYQGWWFDPSDLSTLFTDDAATVNVGSDGDPVAVIKDKSGNGNDAYQTSSSARPIYRTNGLFHWLDFGTTENRFLIVPQVISGTQDRTVSFGLEQEGYGGSSNSRSFLSLQTSGTTGSGEDWSPSLESDAPYIRVDGNGFWSYDSGVPSAEAVVAIRWGSSYGANVSTSKYKINGVQLTYAGGSDQPVNTRSDTISHIGRAVRQNSTYYDGKMFQMFAIRKLLVDLEVAQLENFIAEKSNNVQF